MTLSLDAKLGLAMRFSIAVDGIDLGSWNTCKGLAVHFNPERIKEGGGNDFEVILPGQVHYEPITLTRAISSQDATQIMRWLSTKVQNYSGGTAVIVLNDAGGDPVAEWSLRNVFPSRWIGPHLDAHAHEVAIESLELIHEGFL